MESQIVVLEQKNKLIKTYQHKLNLLSLSGALRKRYVGWLYFWGKNPALYSLSTLSTPVRSPYSSNMVDMNENDFLAGSLSISIWSHYLSLPGTG